MKKRRVVITGLGIVSPVGIGKEKFWESLVQGRSGIERITAFDPSDFPSQIAGEVNDFEVQDYVGPKRGERMSRFSQFAVASAKMAVDDAGLEIEQEAARIGVCFGTSVAGGGRVAEETHRDFLESGVAGVKPWACLEYSPHAPTSYVSIELGIKGIAGTLASACTTGLDVIDWGCLHIRSYGAEAVIVGGTDAPFSPLNFSTFCSIGVLSRQNACPSKASRPYDRFRDGMVLSEGAGAVVLEELEHALDRGARIYAEVLSFANVGESGDMRKCETDGASLAQAIWIASAGANLNGRKVDYINSHGNSMPDYDFAETNAFKKAFGKQIYNMPVSSVKSMTGQGLAASGGWQVAASCLALQNSLIPPTTNYEFPDPRCDLDYVPNKARSARIDIVLVNAHSMGGMHSALILGRLES